MNKEIEKLDKQIEELQNKKKELTNNELNGKMPAKFIQYTEVSYAGRQLLSLHKLDEYGTWDVRGEDPNPDFHGSHHNPYLGTFEGKLLDVIKHAITLNQFFTWGGGGEIRKVEVIKLK